VRRVKQSGTAGAAGQAGISLIEVLIATMVLALAALIAFPTLLSFFDLSKMARDENIATHDLRSAAEDMMATPFANLTTTYVDGEPIPKYQHLHLWDQEIVVQYEDSTTDPLTVQLVATWRDSRGRSQQQQLQFTRTQ